MTNLAHFTANGRIRELIVFDYETFTIPSGPPSAHKYDAILLKYRHLAQQLNAKRDTVIKIHVMFDVDKPADGGIWEDSVFNLRLLPVNSIVPKANIPGSWTQDLIHVTLGEILLDSEHISSELGEVFKIAFGCSHNFRFVSFKKLPEGGNFIRIIDGEKEKGIEGNNLNLSSGMGQYGEDRIRELKVERGYYQFLDWNATIIKKCPGILKKIIFHLDQYLTPVGKYSQTRDHLFLIPSLIYAESGIVNQGTDCLVLLNDKLKELPNDLLLSGFSPEEDVVILPLFLLKKDTDPFGFCYNNCLIENYYDGVRKFTIYFPCFRLPAEKFLTRHSFPSVKNEFSPLFVETDIVRNLKIISQYLGVVYDFKQDNVLELKDAIMLTNTIIDQIEEVIRDLLFEKNIPKENVSFIDFDFFEMSERLGSLHCRVKVIERDCLP